MDVSKLWGDAEMKLDRKNALVTGGSARLGRAISLGLAAWGADIAMTYTRSRERAEDTMAEIQGLGRRSALIKTDFSQPSTDMYDLIHRASQHLGGINILINNAAIFEKGDWDTTTEENWDRHFAINLKSPFFLCQAFAKALPTGSHGHIVNIADWRGVRPSTDHIAYTLAKSALITMTKSLALSLAPFIQVNAIAPGMILPPPGMDRAVLTRMSEKIPVKKPGNPDDIVSTVIYLLESEFVTGDLIYVTGGEHL
ncbi:MAG: SDR family oxidoreductase [Anaerolineae bacterium]|nr:SDR family oxidoreductase [Anaerolineae bacterium]